MGGKNMTTVSNNNLNIIPTVPKPEIQAPKLTTTEPKTQPAINTKSEVEINFTGNTKDVTPINTPSEIEFNSLDSVKKNAARDGKITTGEKEKLKNSESNLNNLSDEINKLKEN